MSPPAPFVREAGAGPGVVCLHANASTSGQWRELIGMLSPAFHVLAPDSYGAGRSPEWPSGRVIRLSDEAALLETVFAKAGSPFALVGHSYGAAIALVAALADPGRVRALALYEPTLFSLIDGESPPPNGADGIRRTVAEASAALDAGDAGTAARLFIDYWMESGSWQRMPDDRKPPIAASVVNVRRWAHALLTEPASLSAFRSLDIPVLLMTGGKTTDAARGVTRLLAGALPRVEIASFDALGHMGPITHPAPVNRAIARFLGLE